VRLDSCGPSPGGWRRGARESAGAQGWSLAPGDDDDDDENDDNDDDDDDDNGKAHNETGTAMTTTTTTAAGRHGRRHIDE
jgi:hypothetical protein